MSRPSRWICAWSLWLLCPTPALAQPPEKRDAPSSGGSNGNWKPYELPDESSPYYPQRPSAPPGASPAREYDPEGDLVGMGLLGVEVVAGSSRGARVGGGAQAGMRFPFLVRSANVDLHGLFGLDSSLSPIGELRGSFDVDREFKKPTGRLLRWGLVGLEVRLLRSPGLWHSYLEFPRLRLGVSKLRNSKGIDAGLRAGWAWVGRYSPDGASRDIGFTVTPAAHLTAYRGPVFLKAEARAFVPLEQSRPLLSAEGTLCSRLLSEVALCASGGIFSGEVRPSGAAESVSAPSWRAGLMVGAGERLGYKSR